MKEGVAKRIGGKPSPDRVEARCAHQNYCGGCSWQELDYAKQIEYKERNVLQQLRRIGGLTEFYGRTDHGCRKKSSATANKMEFTFIQERWLTPEEISTGDVIPKDQGLGFPRSWKVLTGFLHIDECPPCKTASTQRHAQFPLLGSAEISTILLSPKGKRRHPSQM